jgi:hypothetical protein
VNRLLVGVHDERAFAAADQTDIEWFRHTPSLRSKENPSRPHRDAPRASAADAGFTCSAQAYINLGTAQPPGIG